MIDEDGSFTDIFTVYPFGNKDASATTCGYLRIEVGDFIEKMELHYSDLDGLNKLSFTTALGQTLSAGTPTPSDLTQVLQFSKQYHLIGLKGNGGSKSIDSLGVIIFDTDCDLNEPNGPGLAAKATVAEKAKTEAESSTGEGPETLAIVAEDSSSGQLVWTSIVLIILVSLLVAAAIFFLIRQKWCKKSQE